MDQAIVKIVVLMKIPIPKNIFGLPTSKHSGLH